MEAGGAQEGLSDRSDRRKFVLIPTLAGGMSAGGSNARDPHS
jgi:hypothetical protein